MEIIYGQSDATRTMGYKIWPMDVSNPPIELGRLSFLIFLNPRIIGLQSCKLKERQREKDPTRGVNATEPMVMFLWNCSLGLCVSLVG